MSKTCPGCGYYPIGPFTDNCPICAEPVRNVRSDGFRGGEGAGGPGRFPPLLVGGWAVVGLILAFLFWGDWPWLLLSLGLCGAAWWAVAQGETLLLRLLGGGLLVLFLPGIWLASQPGILPGLDRRDMSPERIMGEMMAVLQGSSPDALRTSARMKTVSGAIYAAYAAVAVPLAFLVPPLLSHRRRRQLGGPFYLSKGQSAVGLVLWLAAVSLLGWLAWPTVQGWAETPNNQLNVNWPQGQVPGGPQGEDEPEGEQDPQDPGDTEGQPPPGTDPG